ncbi:MAG: phosphodiester glycosidase family protein [Candidatus Lernaella stagnicola]|nr:phosphodiester glycosidase family protein [Candidatus Lernaella stagnicola]
MARGERRRRIRFGPPILLGIILVGVFLFVTKPQWLVGLVTQYVEERRQDNRPLVNSEVGKWKELEPGLDYRRVRLRRQGGLFTGFHLAMVRVNPALLDIRIVFVPSEKLPLENMSAVAQRTGAVALMNASYFEADMKVMGLLVSGGKVLSPLRQGGRVHHGVFFVRGRKAYLKHRSNVNPAAMDEAFQAGPWLVTDGKPRLRFRNADVVTRRSVLGVDAKGRVVFAATDAILGGLTLPELAGLLGGPEPEGLEMWRVINCDGGTSTQMMLRHRRKSLTIRSSIHVPVYLGVFPRKKKTE